MTISKFQEYELPNGDTISIQYSSLYDLWEVSCWTKEGINHWYKEFNTKTAANEEFERWKR